MKTEELAKGEKRVYITPQLIVHGTVEEITALQFVGGLVIVGGVSMGRLMPGATVRE